MIKQKQFKYVMSNLIVMVSLAFVCLAEENRLIEVELTQAEGEVVRETARDEIRVRLVFTELENEQVRLEVLGSDIISLGLDVMDARKELDREDERFEVKRSAKRKIDHAAMNARIDEQQHPEVRERIERHFIKSANAAHVNIVAEGMVVDEDGNPLDGVSVSVSRVVIENPMLGWDGGHVTERIFNESIDGAFRLEVEGAYRMVLRFHKDDYHHQRMMIFPDRDLLRDGVYHEKNIRVVMQPIGDPDPLIYYRSPLHFYADGSGEVIDFNVGSQKDPRPSTHSLRQLIEDVEQLNELTQKIPNGLSVVAEVSNEGLIKTVEDERGFPKAAEITFRIHDPEGGFIPYESTDPGGEERIFRSMREAPERGYQREWTLRTEDFDKRHLFYFRSHGHYGKGYLTTVRIDRNKSNVRVFLRLKRHSEEGERSVITR